MTILWTVVAIVLAYLLGSVPGGLMLGRLAGVNLREFGSGNPGATNALRARGPVFGIAVFVFDCAKGIVAALLLPRLAPGTVFWLPEACAAAAVVGHVFPVWFRFRGGKGFATALGAILVVSPLALAPVAGVWILVLLLSGYVSLATMTSICVYPIFVAARFTLDRPALLALAIFLAIALVHSHRTNIRRLVTKEEYCFKRVRLLGRNAR